MIRLKALKRLDQFLNWSVSRKFREYPLAQPSQQQSIEMGIEEVRRFAEKYGYFSKTNPITARVTSDERDLIPICTLLNTLYEKKAAGQYLEIALAEILTKVLAYRDLKKGQTISIPIETDAIVTLQPFSVDHVFNLWHGMPAFGLIPETQGVASILLFRGTDFTILSTRGWASALSDLDRSGPGLHAFRHAQGDISSWLKKSANLGKKARAMGFSLGGALATYTFLYENDLLSDRPSIAVCGPGLTDELIKDWHALPAGRQKSFESYVNLGDIVPKAGKQFGAVYCLSVPGAPKPPVTAHTMLICSEPLIYKARVLSV